MPYSHHTLHQWMGEDTIDGGGYGKGGGHGSGPSGGGHGRGGGIRSSAREKMICLGRKPLILMEGVVPSSTP